MGLINALYEFFDGITKYNIEYQTWRAADSLEAIEENLRCMMETGSKKGFNGERHERLEELIAEERAEAERQKEAKRRKNEEWW